MSTSAPSPLSVDSLGPLGPMMEMMAQEIRPVLGLLVIYTTFGAMLIPLLVALLYFSPTKRRWTPIFSFVIFDVLLGLGFATWTAYWLLDVLFHPLDGLDYPTTVAFPLLQSLGTWAVDLVLLVRLLAVFPFHSTPWTIFWGIFTFPFVIKIARLVLIIVSITLFAKSGEAVPFGTGANTTTVALLHSTLLKTELICGMADHVYASIVFLWKLRSGFAGSSVSGRVSESSAHSLAGRIRTLFYIALSNFVLPGICNLIILIIIFRGNKLDSVYVLPINLYISIIGVVFATVWNSSYLATHPNPQGSSMAPASAVLPSVAYRGGRKEGLYSNSHELSNISTIGNQSFSSVIDIGLEEKTEKMEKHRTNKDVIHRY